ncbi:MFS transporter, FHS family, L-fucose permease [Mucilaginibacter mallensis]|uniref:MFS transporter, FHS family, L-fucose permease n=1 Tax=Mucilaginibacter mallensis TaxID=652787 RepID=A0A1H1X6F5_MUCMA|nr:L-fucose:H+ symporter permease [Mucilaginibacter mallensis]SDT04854.1 MFS transporter, FHS family, L-fucose permease [Mucilaginibacter mallensis]
MGALSQSRNEVWGFVPRRNLLSFSLVTMLFLIWGIPNNMNDILIKQFMKSFELSRTQAGLIQSAFYMGYFFLAVPSGLIMKKYSYKVGLIAGLLLFALGCCLFWPAAVAGKYGLFLFALFVIASGLTFLETGANIFIVELGESQSAERRLNFSQAFNPIGAVLGVLIGTIFILSGIEHDPLKITAMKLSGEYQHYLQQETMRVVTPYLVLAAFAVLWSIFLMFTKFPKGRDELKEENAVKANSRELLKYPHFYKGVISQFFYCGAQTCTWSFFIQYVQDFTGQPEKIAGYFLTGTLVAFGVGRFSATYIMRYVSPGKLMGIYGFVNVGLVAIAILIPGFIGVWAIFFTSFFMSLMYPTNFALSIRNLGNNAKIGGSIMVMAIVGGAFFPPVMGLIAESTKSMAIAMVIPLICYLYIAYYALRGSKIPGELIEEVAASAKILPTH